MSHDLTLTPYHMMRKWCPIAEDPHESEWFMSKIKGIEDTVICRQLTRPVGAGPTTIVNLAPDHTIVQDGISIHGIWHLDDSQRTIHIEYLFFSYYYPYLYKTTIEESVVNFKKMIVSDFDMKSVEWQRRAANARLKLRANPLFEMKTGDAALSYVFNNKEKKAVKDNPYKTLRIRSAEFWTGAAEEMWFLSRYETYQELHDRLRDLLIHINIDLQGGGVVIDPEQGGKLQDLAMEIDYVLKNNLLLVGTPKPKDQILLHLYKMSPFPLVNSLMIWNHEPIEFQGQDIEDGLYILEDKSATVALFYVTNFSLNMYYWAPTTVDKNQVYTIAILDMDKIIQDYFGGTFEDVCFIDTVTLETISYGHTKARDPQKQGRYLVVQYTIVDGARLFSMHTRNDITSMNHDTITHLVRNNRVYHEEIDYSVMTPEEIDNQTVQKLTYIKDWRIFHCIRRCKYDRDMVRLSSPLRTTFRLRGLFALSLPKRPDVVGTDKYTID
jgi:hypothetical protein